MQKIKNFINQNIGKPCEKALVVFRRNAIVLSTTATLALGSVGDVMGQIDIQRNYGRFLEKNVPNFNTMPSAYAKISVSFWRLRPFIQFEQRMLIFGENTVHQYDTYARNLHGGGRPDWLVESIRHEVSRNNNEFMNFNARFGVDFRVLNNTNLRAAVTGEGHWSFGVNNTAHISRRMAVKSHFGVVGGESVRGGGQQSQSRYLHPDVDGSLVKRDSFVFDVFNANSFNKLRAGIKLKIKLVTNLNLRGGVAVSHKFSLNNSSTLTEHADFGRENVMMPETRNILHFSLGIHKNFPIGVQHQPQQSSARTPRPTHRVVQPRTCPHMQPRSWERPRTFNHPTAR